MSWTRSYPHECLREEDDWHPYWWWRQHGGSPSPAPQQTVALGIKRPLPVVGTGSSARAIVYVRAQVHDLEKDVVTTSNWLRWELGGGQ